MPKAAFLRPTVRVDNSDLWKLTEFTWAAIGRANYPPTLFSSRGAINLLDAESGTLKRVTIHELRWWLTRNLDCLAKKGGRDIPKKPPVDLLQNLLAAPNKPLPELHSVVHTPIFGRDGGLISQRGYSDSSKVLYIPPVGFTLPAISTEITDRDLARARSLILDELLGDFPFIAEASKAHIVAALLLPFVRLMIDGPTPLHLISKPKAGSGATLLSEIVSLVNGGPPYLLSWPHQEGERKRVLLSALLTAPRVTVLDNISRLEGAALSSCLTQTSIKDRLIGSSDMGEAENHCLWIATGNNPFLSDEIARRTVHIRLDANVENPDQRSGFRHPELKRWLAKNWGDLVWAALIPIKRWVDEGMPHWQERRLGGFESWYQVIGGILEVFGIPGFLQGIEMFRRNVDDGTRAMAGFLQNWWGGFGEQPVTASALVDLAFGLDIGNGPERGVVIRLGKILAKHEGQIIAGFRINKENVLRGNQLWRLTRDGNTERGGCGGGGG